MLFMKYLVVLFSSLIIGQMIGYLGSALSHTGYSPMSALICSLIIAAVVFIIGAITPSDSVTQES